jgi:hypothetical protein
LKEFAMSYRIEYQWACLAITAEQSPGLTQPRFAIAIEGGDNNCYVQQRGLGRRARDWNIGMIGTAHQVLRQATRFASSCETGMLKPQGRDCSPEAYVARIRRLLANPMEPSLTLCYLALAARLPSDHPIALAEPVEPFTYYPDTSFGRAIVKLIPPGRDHWSTYFEMLDPYLNNYSLAPWSVGQVYGLPTS